MARGGQRKKRGKGRLRGRGLGRRKAGRGRSFSFSFLKREKRGDGGREEVIGGEEKDSLVPSFLLSFALSLTYTHHG